MTNSVFVVPSNELGSGSPFRKSILVELVLVYAETPNNFFRNRSYHLASERYEFQSKHSLSASGRPGYDSREWMFPPRVHLEE